jgi:hypothetical protein
MILLFAIFTTLFTYFINFCFNEGNIFDFYYSAIYYNVKPFSEKLYKAIGGCFICFNIWINLFCFEFFYIDYFDVSYFILIPYLGIAFTTSLILSKIDSKDSVKKKKYFITNPKTKK